MLLILFIGSMWLMFGWKVALATFLMFLVLIGASVDDRY